MGIDPALQGRLIADALMGPNMITESPDRFTRIGVWIVEFLLVLAVLL